MREMKTLYKRNNQAQPGPGFEGTDEDHSAKEAAISIDTSNITRKFLTGAIIISTFFIFI